MEDDVRKEVEEEWEEQLVETDQFSNFMFGEKPISHKKIASPNHRDRKRVKGDSWILGINPKAEEPIREENSNLDTITNFLDQIDIELLMKNVDLFMTSANDLKPLIKKVTPLLRKWMD